MARTITSTPWPHCDVTSVHLFCYITRGNLTQVARLELSVAEAADMIRDASAGREPMECGIIRAPPRKPNGGFQCNRLLLRQSLLLVAEAVLFAALPMQAQLTIAYPNLTDVTIQDAVARAGCGGTVLLAAGTYTGDQLSTVPDFPRRLLLSCGSRLIGAGIDKTVIDGTNSPSPTFGDPIIGIGADPKELHPFTSDFELAYLTVTTSSAR